MDDVQREEQQTPAAGPRRSGASVKTSIVLVEVDARQNRAGSLANEAHEPKKVLGDRYWRHVGEAFGQRPAQTPDAFLRTQDDAGQDGP